MGFIADVVANTPILSAWGNNIRNRVVMQFANAAERTSQWTAPPEGAVSYLSDTDSIWYYSGTAWIPVTGSFGCRLTRTTAQSIPNNVLTLVQFNTAVTDAGGFYNSGNGDVTIPAGLGGLYVISTQVTFPIAFWVSPSVGIRIDNTTTIRRAMWWQAVAGAGSSYQVEDNAEVTVPFRLNAGQRVSTSVHHISAGPATIAADTTGTGVAPITPTLDVWRVGP